MTKEQEEAIERCNKLIETEHSNWIGISNQKAIETVLNMLKEQDAKIEKKNRQLEERNNRVKNLEKEAQNYFDGMVELNSELVKEKVKGLNESIKASKKADTDLDDLDKGWKVELEKKDKMIDLLIDYIDTLSEYYTRAEGKNNEFCDEKCIDKNIDCYDCIKQYFERKAEQKGE